MQKNIFRIIVVDDVNIVLKCISAQLNDYPDITVVGQANSVDEALQLIENLSPDIVLLDIKMPEKSGFDLINIAKKKNYKCKFIMMSVLDDGFVLQSIRSGAMGYVSKTQDIQDIVNAIKAVQQDKIYIPNQFFHYFIDDYTNEKMVDFGVLTNKEREIIFEFIKNPSISVKKIAYKLHLSENTIYTHLQRICHKCHIKKINDLRSKLQNF